MPECENRGAGAKPLWEDHDGESASGVLVKPAGCACSCWRPARLTLEGLKVLFIAFRIKLLNSHVIERNMNPGHHKILLVVPEYIFVISDIYT